MWHGEWEEAKVSWLPKEGTPQPKDCLKTMMEIRQEKYIQFGDFLPTGHSVSHADYSKDWLILKLYKTYLFAATIQYPKETDGKQDFPTGFQLWERLRLLRESESFSTGLGSSQDQCCEALFPWKKTIWRAQEFKIFPRDQENTMQQPAATKSSKAHQLNSSQTEVWQLFSKGNIMKAFT